MSTNILAGRRDRALGRHSGPPPRLVTLRMFAAAFRWQRSVLTKGRCLAHARRVFMCRAPRVARSRLRLLLRLLFLLIPITAAPCCLVFPWKVQPEPVCPPLCCSVEGDRTGSRLKKALFESLQLGEVVRRKQERNRLILRTGHHALKEIYFSHRPPCP